MKVALFLPVTIVVTVALVGIMKIRKKEHDKEDKRNKFQDIKLRVTFDVLGEYRSEQELLENLLGKTQEEQSALEQEVNRLWTKVDAAKAQVDICLGGKVGRK